MIVRMRRLLLCCDWPLCDPGHSIDQLAVRDLLQSLHHNLSVRQLGIEPSRQNSQLFHSLGRIRLQFRNRRGYSRSRASRDATRPSAGANSSLVKPCQDPARIQPSSTASPTPRAQSQSRATAPHRAPFHPAGSAHFNAPDRWCIMAAPSEIHSSLSRSLRPLTRVP